MGGKSASKRSTEGAARPRRRRTTAEIIDRLLEAASEEFERNGYDRTKTATIANRAAVTEALIFSHFGTKSNLFREAVFKPLNQHFRTFSENHVVSLDDPEGMRVEAVQYIRELQDFVGSQSRVLMSLVVEQLYASDTGQGIGAIPGLEEYFAGTTAITADRYADDPVIPPELLARISFATIFSCVIFKDWLFAGSTATPAEINRAVADFIMEGISINGTLPGRPVRTLATPQG